MWAFQLKEELDRSGLTFEEVRQLGQAGGFEPLAPPKSASVMNDALGEDRWYRLDFENGSGRERVMVLDLIWRIYDRASLYRPTSDGEWSVELNGGSVSRWDPRR